MPRVGSVKSFIELRLSLTRENVCDSAVSAARRIQQSWGHTCPARELRWAVVYPGAKPKAGYVIALELGRLFRNCSLFAASDMLLLS